VCRDGQDARPSAAAAVDDLARGLAEGDRFAGVGACPRGEEELPPSALDDPAPHGDVRIVRAEGRMNDVFSCVVTLGGATR
jgi:hypothetical protein